MLSNDRPIVIIKKKAVAHGGHHGGSWKVAYADFVTAMMAFFLVMWILGLNQDTRKAIAAYFNDPTGMMRSHAGGSNPMDTSHGSPKTKPSILPLKASAKRKAEKEQFQEAKKTIEQMLGLNNRLHNLQKFVDIEITKEGLRIELLEAQESLFFETGSANLKPDTIELLRNIGKIVGKLPNGVVIEGHTDARPYAGGATAYSNWDLSADRANMARRAMADTLRTDQVQEVRGYADRRLRVPADPMHFSNRRISILVPYSLPDDGSATHEVGTQDFSESVKPAAPNFAAEAARRR